MKKVISASRRTDLVAFFPGELAQAIHKEKIQVLGPSGYIYHVDLSPDHVHTFVFWSKNFSNLIKNHYGLRDAIKKYSQIYVHFTITGLGGSFIERKAPSPSKAIAQLDALLRITGNPKRISVRFDPILYWMENYSLQSNIGFFEKLAPRLDRLNVREVRLSFAQWYRKARRRSEKRKFAYIDPPKEKKHEEAVRLAESARSWGINLHACCQEYLTDIPGINRSSCIDGKLFKQLHPEQEDASTRKDGTQRKLCGCTESVDIGSYTQVCPHACLYCYANPKV